MRPPAPARPWLVVALLGLGVAALPGGLGACSTTCDREPDVPPAPYTGGTSVNGDYQSSPLDGPFLSFPAGRTYRFVHGLGRKPERWTAEFASAEHPLAGKDPPGIVPAAGNQATLDAATAEYIDVRNDTCSDVWLRVTASAPASGADAAVDAPGD